ncbi:uncharacterized protein LOC129962513 isoform X2 [Argiope bruennichi]|uniref:uncharacterized protein LOC129962513 isoform X2 n=1 Tax=Argiope bruennichi TaxID=94029 RepID=UPI00249513FF|nr:uncharacterized protein LOC129962513 isoform X2 [Argiope bruennichi]
MMSFRRSEIGNQRPLTPNPHEGIPQQFQRIQSNRMMLDLRQQVQWQNKIIRELKIERDRLTKELASRLFFVEAQLRREQKHIESLLNEKDQYIHFQDLQIESLKSLLSQVDLDFRHNQDCSHRSRSASTNASGRRSKMSAPPLSKRYSVAIDEYMKDNGIVSRALPVVVQMDANKEKKECSSQQKIHSRCIRTLSLPDLHRNKVATTERIGPDQCYGPYNGFGGEHALSQDVIDELAARRWASDCDSEHSDSLDSGISSPSITSRSLHLDEIPHPVLPDDRSVKSDNIPTRRGCAISNFLNRKFSFSSTQLEKIKDRDDNGENRCNNTLTASRRHNSFSEIKTKDFQEACKEITVQKVMEEQKPRKFISSANRTFGTNHRSVTKPRDIKFRKLFKFRRRAEPTEQEVIHCEDYMTV